MSRMFFTQMTDLIRRGRHVTLDEQQVPSLREDDIAAVNLASFRTCQSDRSLATRLMWQYRSSLLKQVVSISDYRGFQS